MMINTVDRRLTEPIGTYGRMTILKEKETGHFFMARLIKKMCKRETIYYITLYIKKKDYYLLS